MENPGLVTTVDKQSRHPLLHISNPAEHEPANAISVMQ